MECKQNIWTNHSYLYQYIYSKFVKIGREKSQKIIRYTHPFNNNSNDLVNICKVIIEATNSNSKVKDDINNDKNASITNRKFVANLFHEYFIDIETRHKNDKRNTTEH